jgi:PAS domain S-box-containing protein
MTFEEALFHNNPNPMWVYDPGTLEIIDVNKAALQFYGYSKSEMLQLTIKDLRPETEIPKLLKEVQKRATELNHAGTWIHQKKNGENVYVNITSHPIQWGGRTAKLVTGHDVTELIKARNEAINERLFTQTITDALPGLYYLVNQEGAYLDWNTNLETVTGYDPDEISNMTAFDFLVEEDHDIARRKIQQVFETGSAEMEARVRTKDGRQIPYLFAAHSVEINNETCLAGMGIDITFKRELQLKAEQQHKLFESIINQTEAVVYIKDEDSKILFANQRFADIMNMDRNDLIGTRDEEFLPEREADEVMKNDQLVRQSGRPMKFRESVTINGHDVEFMTLKVPLENVPGFENAIAGISTDVTELKQAERKAHTRAEQQAAIAELGIFAMEEFDLQELFDRITKAAADILDVEYCKVLELHNDDQELLLRSGVGWEEGLVGSATVKTNDKSQGGYALMVKEPVVVTNLDKETRFTDIDMLAKHNVVSGISTIIHGHDSPYGILGAHSSKYRSFSEDDVHFLQSLANLLAVSIERIKAQQRYQELNRQLEQHVRERTKQLETANQELESFSYSVSHDLRAPLRAIQGYANLLFEDYTDSLEEEPAEFLHIIREESQRMGDLIDDLLAFSRMNRSEKNTRHINMNEVVQQALDEVGREYNIADADINIGTLPDAMADYKLMQQVWINLLSNAIKYSSKQDIPVIEIEGQEDHDQILYQVSDNGVGFNPKYKDKLFGVFERLHSSSEFEGTGIGLALVHRVITRHNGEIWAESEPGYGSTFYFTLPKS